MRKLILLLDLRFGFVKKQYLTKWVFHGDMTMKCHEKDPIFREIHLARNIYNPRPPSVWESKTAVPHRFSINSVMVRRSQWPDPPSQDWGIKCWICWWVAWMISAVCQAMGAESWGETSRFSLWWSSIAMEPTDDLPMRHGDFPELCERMWVWMVNPMKYSLLNHGQTTIKSPFWTFRKTCKTCRSCCARQHFQGAETRDFAMFITDTEVAVGAGELMLGLWRGLIL